VSPLIEACVLPAVFLTVTLLGALRPGAVSTFVPPSPASLVAAVVLLAILVRSGALAPERLLNQHRPPLAAANGIVVLVTLFIASAQVTTLLIPESGVPALLCWTVLASLLAQALAIGPDRVRVLRGLLVTFGAAFVLKFIVLAALSSPAEGRVAKALQLLFEGVTLGTISQRPPHPLDAYLAFTTLALYLIGVAWLPSAAWYMVRTDGPQALPMRIPDRNTSTPPTTT
jgi:hypothetical protein